MEIRDNNDGWTALHCVLTENGHLDVSQISHQSRS